jgi:hypothetical protein
MSATSFIRIILLPLAIACAAPVFAAEDATVHQVYQAAEAGKFDEAQAMMDKVLRDHPNSGKAHYIEAELLAKQGRMIEAESELAKAERLAPGLPFAKPAAVQKLKTLIAGSSAVAPSANRAPAPTGYAQPSYANRPAPAAPGSSMPWGMLVMLAGVVALVIFAIRSMRRKAVQTFQPAGPGGYAPAGFGGAPGQPYQPPYGGAPGAPGIGSGIMGGLATGAAVGAGIVAGEALMHHFTDRDNGNNSNANQVNNTPLAPEAPLPDDMGGTDFGISDGGGSWDDGGGSDVGGDDW